MLLLLGFFRGFTRRDERRESGSEISQIREGNAEEIYSWDFKLVKEVTGRLIASDIFRSVVGLIFDLLKPLQCDSAEVRSFRKILPH